MRGKKRVQRSYSSEERAAALEELALNGGNIAKIAKKIDVSAATLYRWRDEQRRECMDSQSEEMKKFIRDAWRNIHSLNKPKFVKELKVQALDGKKSNLKEVFAAVSILVREVRLQSKVSKGAKPNELEDNLSEEDLERMIAEEKRKLRNRETGQDEGKA